MRQYSYSRGLLALQSVGDVESAVKLMQSALDIDEKCEFAYETLGTIGGSFWNHGSKLRGYLQEMSCAF